MKLFSVILFLLFSLQVTAQISDFKDIDFQKADNRAKLFEGNNLYNLPLLTYNLTSKLETDVEKFRAIYTWICTNIKGNYSMHRKVSRKRKKLKKDSIQLLNWNKEYTLKVFKDLRKNKRTMCTGYAYLLKTMTNIANIECKIIDGYGKSTSANIGELSIPNHSWNAVKLNNKWYLTDATWSAGYTDLSINTFIFDYNVGYFLSDPKLFLKNHFPIDKKWTLLKNTKTTTQEFVSAPLIYGETFKYSIIPFLPNKMDNDIYTNQIVEFKLQITKEIETNQIELLIISGSSVKKINPTSSKKEKDTLKITHQFKKKGFYDVHILYKGGVVTTYTFNIKSS